MYLTPTLSGLPTPERIQETKPKTLAELLGMSMETPVPEEGMASLAPADQQAALEAKATGGNYDILSKLAMLAGFLTGTPLPMVIGAGAKGAAEAETARGKNIVTEGEQRRATRQKESFEKEGAVSNRITALAHKLQAERSGGAEADPKQLEAYLIKTGVFDKIKAGTKLSAGEQAVYNMWTEIAGSREKSSDLMMQWLIGQMGGMDNSKLTDRLRSLLSGSTASVSAPAPAKAPKPAASATSVVMPKVLQGVKGQKGKDRYSEGGHVWDWNYKANVWEIRK